jgi:hypothetical protein
VRGNITFEGDFSMKYLNSSLIGQAVKASVVAAALMLSTSAGHA